MTKTATTTTSSCSTVCRPRLQDWFTAAAKGAAEDAENADAAKNWDRILLLDGGVSTHLAAKNNDNDGNGGTSYAFAYKELWSSSLLLTEAGRQAVLQGHLDWLQAGSNLISTVTYQCHYLEETWPVAAVCNENDMNELWKHGIQLAAQALKEHHQNSSSSSSSTSGCTSSSSSRTTTRRPTFLVASSGCYGAALANGAEYTGDYGASITMQDLMHFHRRKLQQIMAVASASSCENGGDAFVDCIAIETVPSLLELIALVQLLSEPETIQLLLKKDNVATCCWISLACGDGECLYDKTPLMEALQVLNALPVDILPAIGLNCCDFRHLSSLADILVTFIAANHQFDRAGRALVLYPNSGEEWDAVAKVFKPKTTATTTTTTAAEHPIVDCLTQVIETVERTWREKTNSISSTTTTALLPYPRIIVGGCCRTTPIEIAALRVAIDQHLEKGKKQSAG
jgi:homocysteine S-methyltransferase